MPATLEAAICLIAFAIVRRLGFILPFSGSEVVRRLGVTRSFAYEQITKVEQLLERDRTGATEQPVADPDARLRIENTVLRYRVEHPGCWLDGGRTVYSDDLRAFVVELAQRVDIGKQLTQEEFAGACGIPLATLKPWLASHSRASAPVPEPQATPAQTKDSETPATAVRDEEIHSGKADDSATAGFTLEMLRIIEEWNDWHGSFDAFVRQHLSLLGLRYGKAFVSKLLHLAAARKLIRREPPVPSARGSTFIPPPGIQWSSDGKEVIVVVDGKRFTVTWQPMTDVGSTATVGSTVRPTEDTAGVISSFNEGVATTGAAPAAVLLDNKAPNKSAALNAALPPTTFVMHGTRGRAQSKATIEGGFGLFAQDLGPVVATIDTTNAEAIARSAAVAVTRAYATGRNHRPRRKDNLSPYELYRNREQSPEKIAAAVKKVREIKTRIDTRNEREAARQDPAVRATLEEAVTRFGFTDEGNILHSLASLPLPTIQNAVAIYTAKRDAGSLPVDAELRYFAGIARHCQIQRELLLVENELVSQVVRQEPLLIAHLERKAAELNSLDLAPRLQAIVRELLQTPAPIARVFWQGRLETEAACVTPSLRTTLRRSLCERVRRCFRATKGARQQLIELLVRLLSPEPAPLAAAT